MSKSDSMENGLLLLVFNNINFANIGDATGLRGSTTAGNLFLSLHTADPGEGGSQTTNETTYTSYARAQVARNSGGFTVSGNTMNLTADVTFATGTGGSGTITHWGIGTALSGAGVLLYSGTVFPNLVVGNGIAPVLTLASTVSED